MDDNNWCLYETKKEIVDPNEPEPTKLNIEFRSIDTTMPFGSKSNDTDRNTKTNWCYIDPTSGDKQCEFNNKTVQKYIINSVNSYGLDKDGNRVAPKYTITLTPEDIRLIREYNDNDNNEYDNYKLITKEGKEQNSFVYDLKKGVLKQYNELGVEENTYGALSSKLE